MRTKRGLASAEVVQTPPDAGTASFGMTVKKGREAVSCSQWNGGFCADSGPSRSDRRRPGLRPFEAFTIDRHRPSAALQDRVCDRAQNARKRSSAKGVDRAILTDPSTAPGTGVRFTDYGVRAIVPFR